MHGGRANRRGVPALYLALEAETALAEYRQLSPLLPPGTVVLYRLTLSRVVDFRGGYMGEPWDALWSSFDDDWRSLWFDRRVEPASWVLGDAVIEAGATGLLFGSSRAAGGTNLVVYPDRLGLTLPPGLATAQTAQDAVVVAHAASINGQVVDEILKDFTAETGIPATGITMSDTDYGAKMQLAARTGNVDFDVALGIGTDICELTQAEGIYTDIDTSDWDGTTPGAMQDAKLIDDSFAVANGSPSSGSRCRRRASSAAHPHRFVHQGHDPIEQCPVRSRGLGDEVQKALVAGRDVVRIDRCGDRLGALALEPKAQTATVVIDVLVARAITASKELTQQE